MSCSCGKRIGIEKYRDITEGYKYLTARQISARLAVYKRRFCSECVNKQDCIYTTYVNCTVRLQ